MSLKIMIAGCAKDERDQIESSVKEAFGGRADNDRWNVSLVNVANQWSIEIDGPEPQFKGLSFVAAPEDLAASVRRALKAAGGAAESAPSPPSRPPAPPTTTPAPPAPALGATPAPPAPAPTLELLPERELELEPDPDPTLVSARAPAQVTPAQVAASPTPSPSPSPSPPPPAPLPKPTMPAAPLVDGDRTDRHHCEGCAAPFDVFYYALAGERMEKCPVACPSCWHVNNVPIASGAGLNGDYRAQAAS